MKRFITFSVFVLIAMLEAYSQDEGMKTSQLISDEMLVSEDQINAEEWMQSRTFITTVSKKKEIAQEAPANITVLTQQQIQDLGVSTLYEALSYIPGITVIEEYFGYTNVVFRNNFQDHYNHKSLLLINGHPSFESINFGYHLEIIPIQSVKQIEVIRGPGSVLYGTDAYAGVINIITFEGDKNSVKTSAKAGSFGTEEYSFSTQANKGDFKLFAASSYLNNDGYEVNLKRDELGMSKEYDWENDVTNAYLDIQYKELTFNAGYFKQDKEKVGFLPIIYTAGQNHYEGYFTDLEFKHSINDSLSFQVNGRYDNMEKDYDMLSRFGGYSSILIPGHKYGGEALINYMIAENVSLTAGTSWDRFKIDPEWPDLTLPSLLGDLYVYYNGKTYTDESSLYSNLSWSLTDKVSLVGGLRYSDNSKTGSDTTPNAGIVYEFSDSKYIKFLYGEAYRAPNLYEQTCGLPGIYIGNINLVPETIKTFDIGLDLIFNQKYSLKSNLYYLSTYDTILTGVGSDGVIIFENTEGMEEYGLEIDFSAKLVSSVSVFVNASYNQGELKENDLDIPFMAEYTANAGLNWKIADPFSLNMNVQYIGERKDNDTDYSADAYTLFNMQMVYSLSEMLKLRIIANNLFDKEYYYPEAERQIIQDGVNGPGQAFYGKIECNF